MIKIASFLEGQTELIFLRRIIKLCSDPSMTSFECIQLHKNKENSVPHPYSPPEECVKMHFMLLNVGNDESVISALKVKSCPSSL